MSNQTVSDPFNALLPEDAGRLSVAWRQLRIPGPPVEFALNPTEIHDPDPRVRFARRTVQRLDCGGGEGLALIDKASPHSLFDLMLSEVSAEPRSTACAVRPATGRTLWRTGLGFVRFVSRPEVIERFGLTGGEAHLALNCDPNTRDRESVQAEKQFHLHLLYWDAQTLRPLAGAEPLAEVRDPLLRRQALDPIAFLGARVLAESLAELDLGIPDARVLRPDDAAVIRGKRPLGCVIRLPDWSVLAEPELEDLVRRLHRRLEGLAADLLWAFTGQRAVPEPWQRHALRSPRELDARIAALPVSAHSRHGLTRLAEAMRDLSRRDADYLTRAAPERRKHLMTLNQPCYSLNVQAAARDTGAVHLILQPKLFSGIGGAGLLGLGGVPSVRVLRGFGTFSAEQWHQRAAFQRDFARFNQELLGDSTDIALERPRDFRGFARGWA